MAVITAIKPQKRQGRFNIFLDNQYAFPLSAEAWLKANLKINQKLSANELEKLQKDNIAEKFYDRALRFLSYRPRSEKEVNDYLQKKGAVAKAAFKIRRRLRKQDLLNDRDFAIWWVRQRSQLRPKGRQGLCWELKQKGISEEVIEAVLFSEKKELMLARKAAAKKLKAHHGLSFLERRQKLIGFLSRRGFSWEVIKKALAEKQKKD